MTRAAQPVTAPQTNPLFDAIQQGVFLKRLELKRIDQAYSDVCFYRARLAFDMSISMGRAEHEVNIKHTCKKLFHAARYLLDKFTTEAAIFGICPKCHEACGYWNEPRVCGK